MGSVGDAISGAGVGSIVMGPVGTALGALGGSGGGFGRMLGTSSGFNANNPIDQEEYYRNAEAGQKNFGNTQAGQQALADALLAQSKGQGPNPAQAMLNQATDRNIKQGAGMIASQKGINPALAARLVSDQTGALSQQAAGQGAVMGAQQQLAAQQQLGNVYGTMGQQNLQNQNILNNALLQGGLGSANINAGVASGNAQRNAGMIGGLLSGAGSVMGGALKGGASSGGMAGDDFGWYAGGGSAGVSSGGVGQSQFAFKSGGHVPGHANVDGDHPSNDTVHALLSPGEIVIPRSKADDPDEAKAFVEHILSKKKRKAA